MTYVSLVDRDNRLLHEFRSSDDRLPIPNVNDQLNLPICILIVESREFDFSFIGTTENPTTKIKLVCEILTA
jgi:hypothetical protein